MRTEHKSRKMNARHGWVSDSVTALQEDKQIEVLRCISVRDVPMRQEYGVWFVLADRKPEEEIVKKVLQYTDSSSDQLMVCRCGIDLIILPPSSEEKGMPGLSDAFAKYLGEIHWPGMLAASFSTDALSDVYRAYRMAHGSWQAAHAIYPENRWLNEAEIRFGAMIQDAARDPRILREARETLVHLEEVYPNGEPIKFLSCYFLDCGMDLNETARRMFLHKNTLKYRRARINELLGYPVEDTPESYALVNMLAMYRYGIKMRQK